MKAILYIITFLGLLLSATLGNAQTGGGRQMVILDYQDFGPPSMSHALLGHEWWQWQAHGDPDPRQTYPVKVVVYRGIPLADVKKRYPVNAQQEQDFRYVAYDTAITYLDQQIQYLRDWASSSPQTALPGLLARLQQTQARLEQK